jgi:integrase
MHSQTTAPRVTGHVALRRDTWYAKYRVGERQFMRKIGPAWTKRGRKPAGHLTRDEALVALHELLEGARRGGPEAPAVDATFSEAADEWLRYVEHDRKRRHSTVRDYKIVVNAHLRPEFGSEPIAAITPERIERYRRRLVAEGRLSDRSVNKLLVALHGIFKRAERAYGRQANPAAKADRQPPAPERELEFYSPEEVWALVRAAAGEQDGTLFLTAAFTGIRQGELVALRWRDVDFANETIRVARSYTHGQLGPPKSGKVRSVPMAPEIAAALARLSQRERFTRDDDLVFPGLEGGFADARALVRRYETAIRRAGLRRLTFHDLRHTFGSIAINRASPVQVKEWMGHSELKTTQRYLHYKSRADEAKLLAAAFKVAKPTKELTPLTSPGPVTSECLRGGECEGLGARLDEPFTRRGLDARVDGRERARAARPGPSSTS